MELESAKADRVAGTAPARKSPVEFRLITFELFRAFVAEGASQLATEASLDYLLFCVLVASPKSIGQTLCFIQVQRHWSFGAWWEISCSSKHSSWS
jgi:hypothetical protein